MTAELIDSGARTPRRRFSVQQWMIGVGFLVLTTLMTVYQFLT